MNSKDLFLKHTAYHEAGHFIIGTYLGEGCPESITIKPGKDFAGRITQGVNKYYGLKGNIRKKQVSTKIRILFNACIILYSGRESEKKFVIPVLSGSSFKSDYASIIKLTDQFLFSRDNRKYFRRCIIRYIHTLLNRSTIKTNIDNIADLLIKERFLSRETEPNLLDVFGEVLDSFKNKNFKQSTDEINRCIQDFYNLID